MLCMGFSQLFETSSTPTEVGWFLKYLRNALLLGVIGLMAIPVQAATAYPKITAEDLDACKKEIAELHRLEIISLKESGRDVCNRSRKKGRNDGCDNVNHWANESEAQSHLSWFMKGNESCSGPEYPCYGLSTYNAAEPNVDFIRTLAKGVTISNPGWADYSYVVDKCVAKLWLAKFDGLKADKIPQARTKITPPAAGAANLSQPQVASCSEEIKNKQIESQSWGGNVDDVAARLGQFQKGLFEGRCKGHPDAQAYIAGANKMIGYGGNASSSGGGSLPPLASSGSSSGSGSTDRSRTRKVHNPAADAKGCVQLIQDSERQGAGTSGNWRFANNCNGTVEIFWCFVQDNGSCRGGGTWTVHAGKGWPTFENKPIRWGACRGRDGGEMDKDSDGGRYTCHLLKW